MTILRLFKIFVPVQMHLRVQFRNRKLKKVQWRDALLDRDHRKNNPKDLLYSQYLLEAEVDPETRIFLNLQGKHLRRHLIFY